jgi:hypothetical protein
MSVFSFMEISMSQPCTGLFFYLARWHLSVREASMCQFYLESTCGSLVGEFFISSHWRHDLVIDQPIQFSHRIWSFGSSWSSFQNQYFTQKCLLK